VIVTHIQRQVVDGHLSQADTTTLFCFMLCRSMQRTVVVTREADTIDIVSINKRKRRKIKKEEEDNIKLACVSIWCLYI
jgi:hypothetical protein